VCPFIMKRLDSLSLLVCGCVGLAGCFVGTRSRPADLASDVSTATSPTPKYRLWSDVYRHYPSSRPRPAGTHPISATCYGCSSSRRALMRHLLVRFSEGRSCPLFCRDIPPPRPALLLAELFLIRSSRRLTPHPLAAVRRSRRPVLELRVKDHVCGVGDSSALAIER